MDLSYDVITQADIHTEKNPTKEVFKITNSDDEDFDKLLDLENRDLFCVKKLFSFGKSSPTDLDYIIEKNEFFMVCDNKVVKIRR